MKDSVHRAVRNVIYNEMGITKEQVEKKFLEQIDAVVKERVDACIKQRGLVIDEIVYNKINAEIDKAFMQTINSERGYTYSGKSSLVTYVQNKIHEKLTSDAIKKIQVTLSIKE